ncbi:hypothetical protein SHK09_14920 [Polaribacter sp. PL03]|uniref:hypothetical protein n=2 Tax=unclassified Polaribacter TaxID=196858 RepID=UPI0029CB0D07|nr:hypothetical protein [Polaribacter sp. PL03]MDX6748087.1 hypothetical protein [Polaribacter sp. PL03]
MKHATNHIQQRWQQVKKTSRTNQNLIMKFLLYILLTYSVNSYSQKTKIANLSFNLNNEIISKNNRKIIEKNGNTTFYFNGNYFEYNKNSELINVEKNEIENLIINSLSEIIIYRNKLIDENIKKSEKNGKLKILENSEVYKQVYIYERKNDSILKYPVIWLEVIECQ